MVVSLKYSRPQYRCTVLQMTLNHLAPELLTRIFEFVVEDVGEVTKEALRSLSLVNTQFFQVMEPIRFRSFTVSSSVQLNRLMLRLTDHPERRGYVRELHLFDYKRLAISHLTGRTLFLTTHPRHLGHRTPRLTNQTHSYSSSSFVLSRQHSTH